MRKCDGVRDTTLLDFEAWRASLRTICGRYNPDGIEPNAFVGWARKLNVYGLAAVDIGWNARRLERTCRDARLDGMEHYYIRIQVAGKSAMIQNNRALRIAVGDVVFVDAAQPVTYFGNDASARWLSLHLPRQSLISHLGFEPKGGSCRRSGTPAGRFLNEVVVDALKGGGSSPLSADSSADSYMRLAVYDLVGALFAPSDIPPCSRSTDKLFARICGVIKDSFSDPDFGPVEAAAGVGISLRYVQKLFTARSTTCSEFIYSLRLDRAAHLLHRRALLRTGQPLSEVAYASGFRDYAHFARKFRYRFGYSPGAHAAHGQHAGDGIVRHGTGESAFLTHDVQAPPS